MVAGSRPATVPHARPEGARYSHQSSSADEERVRSSPVALASPGGLPLAHAVRNQFDRGIGCLTQVHVAGDLALHALAFVTQTVLHALQFENQILDFVDRRTRYALNERADSIAAQIAPFRRLAQRGDVATNELANFAFEFRVGGIPIIVRPDRSDVCHVVGPRYRP